MGLVEQKKTTNIRQRVSQVVTGYGAITTIPLLVTGEEVSRVAVHVASLGSNYFTAANEVSIRVTPPSNGDGTNYIDRATYRNFGDSAASMTALSGFESAEVVMDANSSPTTNTSNALSTMLCEPLTKIEIVVPAAVLAVEKLLVVAYELEPETISYDQLS